MNILSKYLTCISTLQNVSLHTVEAYKRDLEQFFSATNKDIHQIERSDVRAFIAHLKENKYKTTSCRRKLAAIKSFFKYCLKQKLISNNCAKPVAFQKSEKRLPKILFNGQIENILNKASVLPGFLNQRNAFIFELLYATGIRVSELTNLKWDDINEIDESIKVFGKGKKWRLIPMTKRLINRLFKYKKEQQSFLAQKNKQSDYLLVNKSGEKIHARGVEFICESFAKKWGLGTTFHPHTFRHTYATALLENGAGIRSVQELLGHQSLSTTQIYTHLSTAKLKREYLNTHPLAGLKKTTKVKIS